MDLILRPFAKYAVFSGRARRLEYWLFGLTQFVIYTVLLLICGASLLSGSKDHPGAAVADVMNAMGFYGLTALALFIPNLSVMVRRLHDTNHSAKWLALLAPGIVNSILSFSQVVSIVANGSWSQPSTLNLLLMVVAAGCQLYMCWLMLLPGNLGANNYGPDPKSTAPESPPSSGPSMGAGKPVNAAFEAALKPSASAQSAALAMERAAAQHAEKMHNQSQADAFPSSHTYSQPAAPQGFGKAQPSGGFGRRGS